MNTRAPLAVGFVLVSATATLSYLVLATTEDRWDNDNTYYLFADFADASGLRGKTRVQVNGIDVGKIEDIQLVRDDEERLVARVRLRVIDEVEMYADSSVRKMAESLLGDYRLDLNPGTPRLRKLAEGDLIPNVRSLSDLDEIQNQLKHVTANVNDVTESFKKVLAGPDGEGSLKVIMERVEHSMEAIEVATTALSHTLTSNDEVINQVIRDLGRVSNRLAQESGPAGNITQLTENLTQLTARLNRIADSVDELLAGQTSGWEGGTSVRDALEGVNESLLHVNAIARKIDDGQGSMGRLINDPAIAERVEQTLDDTSELIGGLSRLETQIELLTEYQVPFKGDNDQVQASIKNTLGLRIFPKPDKYYLLEAIADPRGTQTRKLSTETVGEGEAAVTTKTEETVIDFDQLKFSAQFAKRYYFLTMRFGIIENTGGLGFNLHSIEDRLELRFDAYDFARRDPEDNKSIFPRLRGRAMFEFIDHIYVQGGIDDPLNGSLRTWFVGGALRFTDEDLKSLLTVAPMPK